MIQSSTVKLLRFPFSFFLMPVCLFALSAAPERRIFESLLAFVLIHLLLYPASNGYNSYMDRDTESIGGIEKPPPPSRELYWVSIAMDVLGSMLCLLISPPFAACYVFYILCSRLYSFRGIRLKRFPVLGYITVISNQGALIFFMTWHAATGSMDLPLTGMLAASLLIGGFYPMTQIYQHRQDAADKVTTISMLLGVKGTFYYCMAINAASVFLLYFFYSMQQSLPAFFVVITCLLPVLYYFYRWLNEVKADENAADFAHTMRMNWIASLCTNAAFLIVLFLAL